MPENDTEVPAPPADNRSTTAAPVADQPRRGSLSRLPGVFMSPTSTFEQIAARPTWLAPLVAWIIVVSLLTAAIFSMVDQVEFYKNQIRSSSFTRQMTDEQIDQIAEQSANSTFAKVGRYLNPILGPPIILSLIAALLWLLLLILGTDLRFKGVLSVVAHAMFAYAIISGVLIVAILYFAEDPSKVDMATAVSSNLGFLVNSGDHPVLHRLVISFDVLVGYFVFLVGFGLSKLSRRVSIGVGLAAITMLYGLWVALQMGVALLFG